MMEEDGVDEEKEEKVTFWPPCDYGVNDIEITVAEHRADEPNVKNPYRHKNYHYIERIQRKKL